MALETVTLNIIFRPTHENWEKRQPRNLQIIKIYIWKTSVASIDDMRTVSFVIIQNRRNASFVKIQDERTDSFVLFHDKKTTSFFTIYHRRTASFVTTHDRKIAFFCSFVKDCVLFN